MLKTAYLAMAFAATVSADSELPSIEVIRNTYNSALTPIFTLECEMHLDFENVRPNALQDPAERYEAADLHLWRKGNWRALYVEYTNGNHELANANWNGFDGTLYGRWTKSLQPQELQSGLPGGILQAEKDNTSYEIFTIDRLTGETLSAGDLPLGMLLENPETKVVGRKDVGGVSCVEVSFPKHMIGRMFPEIKTAETTAWLDPAHSYLPRLIRRQNHTAQGPDPRQTHEFQTTEFGSFIGEDKRAYTLPVAGESRNIATKTRLKLIRATINAPLADQLFKPDYPALAEIHEKLPNRPPQVVVIGDLSAHQRAHDEIMQRAVAATHAKPSVLVTAPSARPRDAGSWRSSRWVQFLGCLLVVGIVVVGVRVWRSRSS